MRKDNDKTVICDIICYSMKKKKASGEPSNIQSSAGKVFHTSAAEEKAKNVAGYLQQVNLHFISRVSYI